MQISTLSYAALFLALIISTPDQAFAQCTNLKPQSGDLGYMLRDTRCEGLYIEDTRSSVRLKSVIGFFFYSDKDVDKDSIKVALPENAPPYEYHLRVSSYDPQVYYRLDDEFGKDKVYGWPVSEVIIPAGIDKFSLAPLSWSKTNPRHYIPVSFSVSKTDFANYDSNVVLMTIESTVPIQKISARLTSQELDAAVDLSDRAELPSSMIELPVSTEELPAGPYKLWLRVLLMGNDAPEQISWDLWLP